MEKKINIKKILAGRAYFSPVLFKIAFAVGFFISLLCNGIISV